MAESRSALELLRENLDAIDGKLLQLLAQRMGIVAEIAGYKREHAVRIRDLAREREVLSDRCAQADELGLPAGIIESIFRLVLLASRERQASLRAELPTDVTPRTMAVVGGKGAMGQTLHSLFAELGHRVLVSDVDTELTPQAAAAEADVVIVSVPIRDTESVVRQVGPHVRPDGLLMDVTSIKAGPMRAMLEATEAAVVGTHPMFGPGAHSFQGQRVVVCPGRGEAWIEWVRQMLSARGLVLTEATPEEHDRMMAVVQVLNHFQTQVLGVALSRYGVPIERSLAFTSPAYLLEAYVAARHFAQSPELYGAIEMLNPQTPAVTSVFREVAAEIAGILERGDQERFNALFQEVRAFFGDFTEEALEQSRYLVDRLVELTAGRPGEGVQRGE
ncbi:MAG: bifunctional chorismate mutase/prephenate dehydrogenase [Myxococcota bacterium]